MQKIPIALLDPHIMVRKAIASLLTDSGDYVVTVEAGNLEELKEKLSTIPPPQVLLMDVQLPGTNGYDSAAWLQQHYPAIKLVALSTVNTDFAISRMADNGVSGFVSKNDAPEKLQTVLHKIQDVDFESGGIFGLLAQKLLPASFKSRKQYIPIDLTDKEIRFLQLCCSNLTYEQIAAKLHMSIGAGDKMRDKLFKKLEVKNRTELCLFTMSNAIHCYEMAA